VPFNLLNPWFLLGALAVLAPLWLHLRRRTEKDLVRFSAVQFLEDSPEARPAPRRLQDLLLLALRALAVALLAAAFAWPYLRARDRVVVRESRVYILDNTMSHQAAEGFFQDREWIAADMRQAGSDVQTAVVELTGQPRLVTGFAEPREEACRKVLELPASFQRGSYLAAFRLSHSLLANSMGERKRVVFCTDSQENQWAENLNTPPFLQNVPVDLRKPARTNASNLALSEPRLQRIFLGEKSLVNFTARLTYAGGAEKARVEVRANGQTILARDLELTNRAGAILLQTQWEADPAHWLWGDASVAGTPDALLADNRVFFSLAPVREGEVALLASSPYVRLALSPEIMQGHWRTRVLEPARLAGELAGGRDAEVLVVESGYLQSADARKLVERYLTNGHGVLLLVNRETPVIAAALRDLGLEVVASVPWDSAPRERLYYVFSSHPIFHPFASPDYGNLLEVSVGAHPRLKPLQAMPLVFSESGEPLFFQGTRFPGRLFVAAFGLDREQTSWPTHVTFIPFLDLCLQNARPEDSTPLDYEPGAVSLLSFAADSPVREVAVRDERGNVEQVPVVQGKARVRLPDRPGLCWVSCNGTNEPEKVFSVNPCPKESQLSYLDTPDALKLWRIDPGRDASGTTRAARPAVTDMSLVSIWQQQWWWWLLVAGLAALLLETVWTSAKARPA
jgi:hypothetical protein